MNTKKLRMPLDILMTLLSIILMGGTILFPDDRIHQIFGITLTLLWVIHIVLNRRWYSSLFKGKYRPYRIMQLVVNCGVLICALLLMISGLMMAWFIPTEWFGGALGFARITHLLASHWYYIFMAFHIGMHAKWIASLCHSRAPTRESLEEIVGSSPTMTKDEAAITRIVKIILSIIFILISLYGVYAFITRGLWKYMLGLQQFFFFDFERGYVLFALDYISIIVLFATVAYYIGRLMLAKDTAK